jgi:ABC-type multidrug transport system ATPase subunit
LNDRLLKSLFFYAGLDSASTFTIVQSLANWAHSTDATIIISLLQPEPQVYDLFDDVMLMANGRIVYHGPRVEAVDYFSGLGFVPPPKKATADFLQVSGCVVSHNHSLPLSVVQYASKLYSCHHLAIITFLMISMSIKVL